MSDTIVHDPEPRKRILVYFLAAPQDEVVCEAIRKYFSPTAKRLTIEVDSDFDIPSGEDREKYKQRLFAADIVLSIISADFIDDENTYQRNQKVIERSNNKETLLIPILARNCLWKSTPFGEMNPLPKTLQPLNNKQFWNSEDDALTAVAEELTDSINEFTQKQALQLRSTIANGSDAGPKSPSETSRTEAETVTHVYPDWRKKYYRGVLLKRGAALVFDYIFLLVVPALLVAHIFLHGGLDDPTDEVLGIVAFYLVAPWMESSQWRSTIGKRIMKLQITDREGERISFFRALWRNILRSLTFYAYCFLLPLIYQYFRFRKTKKLFHDELSNTVIGERLDAAQQPSEAAKKEEQEPRIRVAEQLILGSEVSEVNGYTSKVTILLESLMNWLKSAWSWLSKPNPKKTLAFIGGALAIATGGVWQAYVTTGITLEQNEAGLNTNETRAKLPNTENADKAKAYYPPYGHNNDYPPAISAQDYLQLDISEKLPLGPDHPDVAQSLNNRAEQYWEQGAYAKAEPLYLQSLKIREKALGPDHPDVAVSLNNLAEIYWAQLAYAKAEPLYQRSLRILEKALGPDHIKVAQSRNNLAKLYWAQGKYAKAERFLKRSLKIREKALGPDNPQVTTSHQNYTALLEIEAEAMKTRANAIQAKHK